MKCIDFDKKFQYYVTEWVKKHAKEFKNYDEMEDRMPEVYEEFLDLPADWLAGVKPGEYFERFDNAKQLVDWMEDYEKQRVPVPDMLLNRISALGKASEAPLMNLLSKERTPHTVRMSAVTLLREIESEAPIDLYLHWISGWQGEDELCENALESLQSLGASAADQMRAALPKSTREGQISLLTVLCDHQKDEELTDLALSLLETEESAHAVLSDVLARLGNDKALPALFRLAGSEETPYLDYIELRNAIEALGGEAPEREFDADDPDYQAMRSIEEHMLHHGHEHEEDACGHDGCICRHHH